MLRMGEERGVVHGGAQKSGDALHGVDIPFIERRKEGFRLAHAAGQEHMIPHFACGNGRADEEGRLKIAFPKVVRGVKDSGGNLAHSEALVAKHGELAILIGDERHLAAIVRKGGQGAICGMANLEAKRMRPLAYDGKDDEKINALVDTLVSFPVVAAIKTMIAHRSKDRAWTRMRAPLDKLDDERAARLAAKCDAAMA